MNNGAAVPIMHELRTATHHRHEQLGLLPFFRALSAHSLPVECYVGELCALAVIYSVTERIMSASDEPFLRQVWREDMAKLPLLENDLAYLRPRVKSDCPKAIEEAVRITELVRRMSVEAPVSLLGYWYVLEGAMLGAETLRPHVAATFHLAGPRGMEYLSGYGDDTRERWSQFSSRMNQLALNPRQRQRIVDAACHVFDGLQSIFELLYPLEMDPAPPVAASLNPEAGRHPIPSDPRETQAAVRAGERCWQQFPYFEARYSNRGRRFASSDSAWLATLCEHDQPVVDQQVRWLGRVLAARGMPQFLLETHLRLLHRELVHAVPEKRQVYEKLRQAAEGLAAMRETYFDQQTMESLAAEFAAATDPQWGERLPRIGLLLVAAVADEKAGIESSVESLESWLTDPARFPKVWINAVGQTIRKAREHAARSLRES